MAAALIETIEVNMNIWEIAGKAIAFVKRIKIHWWMVYCVFGLVVYFHVGGILLAAVLTALLILLNHVIHEL